MVCVAARGRACFPNMVDKRAGPCGGVLFSPSAVKSCWKQISLCKLNTVSQKCR